MRAPVGKKNDSNCKISNLENDSFSIERLWKYPIKGTLLKYTNITMLPST